MKSLLFSLSVLALVAMTHSIPCIENRCGGYSYMGGSSFGYASANVGVSTSGGYEVQGEINGGGGGNMGGGGGAGYNGGGGAGFNGGGGAGFNGGGGAGYNGGGGAGYEGGGGGSGHNGGGGSGHNGGGGSGHNGGGGSGHNGGGGGGYYGGGGGYYSQRRSSYCPNCYVKDFGNGIHNANTINIKHRRN